jgi:serine/threonine-protein kinase HipA
MKKSVGNKIINVVINKRRIGRIALDTSGLCAFEYDAEWLESGYSISPFFMPLRSGLIVAGSTPFEGNFGVFDDSLPDGWGSLLLDRYLRNNGINPDSLSIIDRLSIVGSSGRGALEYQCDKFYNRDAHINPGNITIEKKTDLEKLYADSRKILNSTCSADELDKMYQAGGSSGGARPKVFVQDGNREWIVKFHATGDPKNVGEVEYKYSLLAKKCGIQMPETKLFNKKFFGAERFDRNSEGKIHTVSAAGLLHADYRIPSLDYITLLRLTMSLTKDKREVVQMFKRMVFNVLISNRDDHAKNFSFQRKEDGWHLSPAYDMLPEKGFNGFHTTTVNGNGNPKLSDILAVAESADISSKEARKIIETMIDTLSSASPRIKILSLHK